MKTFQEFEELVTQCSPSIQELIHKTKLLIKEVYPDFVEVPWVQQKTIGYGIGEKKMSEHFCWIGVYSKHIILGFNYGTELDDPEKILEGTGKLFRHYKIKGLEDLENPALKKMVSGALKDIKARQKK